MIIKKIIMIFSYQNKILPAHYVDQVDGSEFIEKYQFKLMPGSGPYTIKDENIVNQDENGDSLFVILAGNARVSINKEGKDIKVT